MAIDDNASYELTGAQVKDLANKIKAKAADNIFVGATYSLGGSKGLVPAPQAGDDTKFLSGDGTWQTVSSGGAIKLNLLWTGSDMLDVDTQTSVTGTTVWNGMTSGTVEVTDISAADEPSGVITSSAMLSTWHDEIYGDLTDVTYFSTVFTVRGNTTKSITYLYSTAHGWLYPVTYNIQKELTAGTNIAIAADGTISATDTTYSDFTGATASTAGAHGLVPAPAAGDQDKYLKADGTWGTVASSDHYVVYATLYNPGPQDAARVDALTSGGLGFTGFYRDIARTQRISGYDLWDMVKNGHVVVSEAGNANGLIISAYDGDEGYISGQIAINNSTEVFVYDIDGDTGVPVNTLNASYFERYQRKLKAGDNITITESAFSESGVTGYRETISASIPVDSALDVTSTNPVQNSVVTAALNNKAANTDMTGATSSAAGAHGLVPAPAAGDQEKVLHGDGTWKDTTAKLVEMSYGESNAWAKFIAAYNAGSIVYCRASSNANPGSGSQTRKAFMAYVNNATSPTSVEFQYVRSQSSKTDSQQCDQVFVYTLTNASGGTWSVASRNMAPKINVDGPITKTFSNGANATITIGANAMTGATSSAAGTAGIVPAPASGDNTEFLRGDGTWATPDAPVITMTDTDPGEGGTLAANNFIFVYDSGA